MPSSACIAQAKMGIRNRCAAFDSGGGVCRVCLRHHDRRPIVRFRIILHFAAFRSFWGFFATLGDFLCAQIPRNSGLIVRN
jgi:hypothetical protein